MHYLMLLNVEMPSAVSHEPAEVLRQLAESGWRPLLDGIAVLSKVVIGHSSVAALRIAHSSVKLAAMRTKVDVIVNLRCVEELRGLEVARDGEARGERARRGRRAAPSRGARSRSSRRRSSA